MSRHLTAIIDYATNYEDCLISSCIKKLLAGKNKTDTGTGYRISNHISEIKTELETLNQNEGIALSYAHLKCIEDSLPDAQINYAIVYRKNKPVLFSCFQLFTLTSDNFNLNKNKGFVKRIVRLFLDLKDVKVLMSGNALRNSTPCCCFDKDVLTESEAMEMVACMGQKLANDNHVAGLVIKDLPETNDTSGILAEMGFQTPWEDQEMVLAIDSQWATIDDYVNALSRKYKTRARKILEAGNSMNVRQLNTTDIKTYSSQLNALFNQVADSQEFTLTHPSDNHFSLMKETYGDEFEVTGLFHKDNLVGFFSAFTTGGAYEMYYCGFSYEHNTEFQLYFNLLYAGLSRAITLQKQTLKLGRTSFDAKASMGAKPASLNYYFKPGFIPSVVTNWFSNYFAAMEDTHWKQRNPFK